jgi:hypothetical protein
MAQQQRDFLIEIEGESVAFTGAGSLVAPGWGQTLVEAVITAPPIQTMGVSPYDGAFQNGGLSVGVTEVSAYLQSRLTEPRTTLTADVNRTTTTVSVTDTSLFAASGVIWVGREAIAYGAKTASAFTGCTRGYYGTTAQEHSETVKPVNGSQAVYGYNPTWFGRKVWIRIFDPTEAAPALTTIASGRIDGVSFDGTGFVLSLISVAQDLERETIAAGQRATGRLRFANVRDEKRRGLVGAGSIPKDQTVASVFVVVDRESEPFQRDTTAAAGVLATVTNAAFAVNDEVISYRQTAYPAISAKVNQQRVHDVTRAFLSARRWGWPVPRRRLNPIHGQRDGPGGHHHRDLHKRPRLHLPRSDGESTGCGLVCDVAQPPTVRAAHPSAGVDETGGPRARLARTTGAGEIGLTRRSRASDAAQRHRRRDQRCL